VVLAARCRSAVFAESLRAHFRRHVSSKDVGTFGNRDALASLVGRSEGRGDEGVHAS